MLAEYPHVCFFPTLPLAGNLNLGEWCVGNPPTDISWRSERFKELVRALLASFVSEGFKNPALLWSSCHGMSGEAPSDDVINAAQASVRFSLLDANDQIAKDLNAGHYLATTENAALYVQPIDEKDGAITHRGGGALKHVLTGGWRIGDRPLPLPDAVVPIDRPCSLSMKLTRAMFDALTNGAATHRRVRIALEWHAVAMSNPRAVTLQQRLIALKTAFEALTGKSNSRKCAALLRKLFEDVTSSHRDLLPWAGLLWAPNERTDLIRPFTKNGKIENDTRSELEDWFMTLAEARNTVIHEGQLSVTKYEPPKERPLSRYGGELFWVGERVLREAIKATLGDNILLCGRLAEFERCKRVLEMIRAATANGPERSPETPALAEELENQNPQVLEARSVSILLAELKCAAANEVVLSKVRGGRSASESAAIEMARSVEQLWAARAGAISIAISEEERDILKRNGAEDELQPLFLACD